MSDINVTMQIADVISQTANLLQLTDAQRKAWEATAVAVVKYDKALEKEVTTVRGMVDATRELQATFLNAGEKGAESLSARLRTVNGELAKAKAAARSAAEAMRLYTAASREREEQARREAAQEQRLNDILAKRAAKVAQQARTEVLAKTVQGITGQESGRLGGLGVALGPEAQGRLFVMARSIAELGVKAGLTAKQLQDMFAAVNRGDFAAIQTKYAGIVQAILGYNSTIQKERDKLASGLGGGKGGPGGDVGGPNEGHLAKAKEYLNLIKRIQGTLTNLAIYRGFNLITNQLGDAVSAARQYEMQVALIRTISQDANLSTGQWTRGLKEVSNTLAVDFKDTATAAYNAVSAQIVQGQATFQYLKDVGELARTTGTSLAESQTVVAGVINSYKLSAVDATDISAKLFRTVDLGNVVLSELAGTIGRVTALGNDLGVSLDEVLATLSTFTRNGVKTSDAMTFLNNVFTKLLSPTTQMKTVLKDIGIESASAAIKTQGFRQVLGQLIDEVQKGKVEAIDLFPEIRGEKGFASFRQNLKEFDRDLKEIGQNSRSYFENAKNIISDTDADKINRFMVVLKNTLTSQVGDSINRLVSDLVGVQKAEEDITQFTDRLEKTVRRLIQAFVTGAVTVTTFVVATRSLGAILEILAARNLRNLALQEADTASKIRNAAATTSLTVAETRLAAVKGASLGGVLATANPLASVAVIGATLFAGYKAYQATATDAYSAVGEASDEFFRKLKEGESQKVLEKQLSIVDVLKDKFKDVSREVGGHLQDALTANTKRVNELNEKLKETQDRLKNAFVGSLDEGKDKLQEINRQLNEIDETLRHQGKKNFDFREQLRQNALGTANKYANPEQQLKLLSNEYLRVKSQITKLVSQGTPEALAEAEKLYDKLGNLATQFYEKQADRQKDAFEDSIKQQVAEGSLDPGKYTFFYDQSQQLKTNNELIQLRNKLDNQGNNLLQQRKKLLDDQRIAQEQENKNREVRIKKFEDFNVFNASGDIKNEYKSKSGKLDVNAVVADYKKLTAELEKDIGNDFLKRSEAKKVFDERGNIIAEQVRRTIAGNDLAKTQKDLADATEQSLRKLDEGKRGLTEYDANIKQLGVDARTLAEDLRAIAESAPNKIAGASKVVGGGVIGDVNADATRYSFEQTRKAAVALIEELKELEKQKIKVNGTEVIDPKKAAELLSRLRQLKSETQGKLSVASQDYKVPFDAKDFLLPGQSGRTLSDLTRGLDSLEERLQKAVQGQAQTAGGLGKAQADLDILKMKSAEVTQATSEQQNALKAFVGGLSTLTQSNIADLERLNMKAQEVNRSLKQMSQGFTDDGKKELFYPGSGVYGWSSPLPKQYGGAIYRAYGGPIGSDQIPVWAREGEIMVNQSASNRFFSQIMTMNNQGRTPQRFNTGGAVSNDNSSTVFNVNGAQSPQATAQAIWQLQKRGRRLGRSN